MEASDLILTDAAAEKEADDLLLALTDLAYSSPNPLEVKDSTRKFRSRFFFKLSKSFASEIKQQKQNVKRKKLVPVDIDLKLRLKDYKKDIPQEVKRNMLNVREFFLTQIGPLTLAGGAGAGQAKEIVQRMLNTAVDGTQFDKFERMSHEAVNLRMARFIAKYYGLEKSAVDKLLTSIAPKTQTIVPIPMPAPQPYESRNAKKSHTQKDSKSTDNQ